MKHESEFKETGLGKFLGFLLALLIIIGTAVMLFGCTKWPTCPAYGNARIKVMRVC